MDKTYELKNQNLEKDLILAIKLLTLIPIAVGLISMLGWLLKMPILFQVSPLFAPINFNNSLLFFLCGSATYFHHNRNFFLVDLLFLFVFSFSLLALIQHIADVDFGIDQFFIRYYLPTTSPYPGRISPNNSICFALYAGSLFLQRHKSPTNIYTNIAGIVGSLFFFLGIIGLLGYVPKFSVTSGWGSYTRLAISTSLSFLSLGLIKLLYTLKQFYFKRNESSWRFSLYLGIFFISMTIGFWQFLLQKEGERFEEIVTAQARLIKKNLETSFKEKLQDLNRMKNRLANDSHISLQDWSSDAQYFLQDFPEFVSLQVKKEKPAINWTWPPSAHTAPLFEKNPPTSLPVRFEMGSDPKFYKLISYLHQNGVVTGQINGVIDTQLFLLAHFRYTDFHYRIKNAGQLVYDDFPSTLSPTHQHWSQTFEINAFDQKWSVTILPTLQRLRSFKDINPQIALFLGSFFSILLSLTVGLYLTSRKKTQEMEILNHRLESLMKLAPAGIFSTDAKGLCTYVNDYFCTIGGFTVTQAQGLGWLHTIHPDDQEKVITDWFNSVEKKQDFSKEYRYLKKNGTCVNVHCTTVVLYGANGAVSGYVGIVLDLTQLKMTESKLNESRNFFYSIADNIPVALFCKDFLDEFRFTVWNKKAAQMWGLKQEEVLGKNDFDFFSHEEAEFFRQKDLETINSGSVIDIDEEIITLADGKKLVLHTKKVPIYDSAGRPRFMLGFSEDITEKKMNEKIIEEQRIKIAYAEKMAAMGEMAAGVAHEINNPLTIISGYATRLHLLAEMQKLDPTQLKNIAFSIKATIERIAKIVKGLRAFAQDGENDSFVVIPFKNIVTESLDFCSARFYNKKVDLRVDDIDPNLMLECRPVQISQVILNLINNSFDAVHGIENSFIELKVKDFAHHLEFRVTDSGQGIPKEIREKIMQPFFTTKESEKGAGLGLSISCGIAQSHSGKLYVDAEATNTSFVLELPKSQNSLEVDACKH